MKLEIKYFLRLNILLIIASSLFFSCQTDDSVIEDTLKNIFPYKITVISEKDIISNVKLHNQIRNISTIKTNVHAKSVYNDVYNFTINTDVVQLIESANSNAHSYTLQIERQQPTNELENIVFTYNSATDDYTANLVTYHFSATQKQEFLLHGNISSSYQVSHQPIFVNINDVMSKSGLPIPCTTNYTVYHITPDTGETFYYGTNGIVENACQHEEEHDTCETYTVIEIDCPSGGNVVNIGHSTGGHSTANNTGGTNHSNAGSNSSSNSGNTNSGNTNSGTSITTPTIIKTELILNIDGLTFSINNWLNENIEIKIELINFLEENPDAEGFVLEAIEALMNDNDLTLEEYFATQIVFEAPDTPIEDINDYLSCFDTTQGAQLTIYVDQPRPGSREAWTFSGGVGHAFVGITQGNTTRVLGLYPIGNVSPVSPDDPLQYGNNAGDAFDVSVSKNITASQLQEIINETITNTNDYNLNLNNCANYAIRMCILGGINVPSTLGTWPMGGGNNPGDLGEDIREGAQIGTVRDLDGGTAPENNGGC